MQHHAIFRKHAAGPGATVETHIDRDGFLNDDFQPPGAELLDNPVFGMVEHVRTDDATSDIPGDIVCVFHGAVVIASGFEDGFDNFVLSRSREGQHKHQQKGQ